MNCGRIGLSLENKCHLRKGTATAKKRLYKSNKCDNRFPGRRSDHLSLARLLKSGRGSTHPIESRHRRLTVLINLNRRYTTKSSLEPLSRLFKAGLSSHGRLATERLTWSLRRPEWSYRRSSQSHSATGRPTRSLRRQEDCYRLRRQLSRLFFKDHKFVSFLVIPV